MYSIRYPYAALAELTFGTKVKNIVTIMLDVTIFGACIPNLLIGKIRDSKITRDLINQLPFIFFVIFSPFKAAYNLHILGLKLSNDQFDVSPCVLLIIIGIILCPPLWLGSPKDMKYVNRTAVFSLKQLNFVLNI